MSKATPGPWRWELNLKSKRIQLCGGKPQYDLTVMDFVRWGMDGAAPRFNTERRENLKLMERIEKFAVIVPGREHHADWFQAVDHPDARLIASAPDMLTVLKKFIDVNKRDGYEFDSNEPELYAEIVAAIAKAETP
jgi:hypothetical protein